MTIRPAVVLARLAHLGDIVQQLDRLRALSPEDREDPLYRLAAERGVHVALEAVFDIGHHVLAGRGHPVPATYREVVPALVAHGILPAEYEARLAGMAGMRNILVHDYVDVDIARVWAVLDERLDDLQSVQAAFAALPELARGAETT